MEVYYIYLLLVTITFFIDERTSLALIFIGTIYFLYVLPSTGMDYVTYKQAYDNSYITNEFPWFKTATRLTSEPFYLWYTSLLSFLTFNKDFIYFLILNFIISFTLLHFTFKPFYKSYRHHFWLLLFPVMSPILFYFSPRSSISFFIVLLAFVTLITDKKKTSYLLFFIAINIHSQYILTSFLIIITYFLFKKITVKRTEKYRIIFIVSIILYLLLTFISNLTSYIGLLAAFMPSEDIIMVKLNYFDTSEGGIRITSFLSIIIYPILAYYLTKIKGIVFIPKSKKFDELLKFLIFAVLCYGAVVNLAFYDSPHIAGRLSRFSDYIGMTIVIPSYFRNYHKKYVLVLVILTFAILAPILFPSVYANANWNFN